MLAALVSFKFGKGTRFDGYHFKCDALECCLNRQEECVRNICALLVKIQEVGSQSQAQLEEGHTMSCG